MERFNPLRVCFTLLGVAGLLVTVLCPWWRYRADDDLMALAHNDFITSRYTPSLETHVGMLPLWDVGKYQMSEWLPFNIIQFLGIVAWWGLGMVWASREQKRIIKEAGGPTS